RHAPGLTPTVSAHALRENTTPTPPRIAVALSSRTHLGIPPPFSDLLRFSVEASWGGRDDELQPGGGPGRDDLFGGGPPRIGHRAVRHRRDGDDDAGRRAPPGGRLDAGGRSPRPAQALPAPPRGPPGPRP